MDGSVLADVDFCVDYQSCPDRFLPTSTANPGSSFTSHRRQTPPAASPASPVARSKQFWRLFRPDPARQRRLLVWSRFPVTVFVEPLKPEDQSSSFVQARSLAWITAVTTAIGEWNQYLPLQQVNQPEAADIQVWRSAPPLQLERDRPNSPLRLGRVRAAETRFQLYSPTPPLPHSPTPLSHRFTILLRPDQAPQYTLATARHELGHAIGIWGHSQQPTDALYFSQVAQPPLISARDVNTLKRIYQQPTQLGWSP